MYSPGSDKLTEVQLYISTSCHPGSRVIRAFSDVEKLFLFSDLARIIRVNKFYCIGVGRGGGGGQGGPGPPII